MTPSEEAAPSLKTGGDARKSAIPERHIVFGLILFTLFLASLPYLMGYAIVPRGMRFIGTAYNIDDFCNYLSWLRQNADGRFFYHNLFTTDSQQDLEFNVFFYLLGQIMHYAHLSPQAVWQGARVIGGFGLLWLIYCFYRHCLPQNKSARLTAFGFVCLSSGFGWWNWTHWQYKNQPGSPVDAWQPEAYTFLSLYTSALFVISTLLIVGALYALLLGEQTGRWRYPVMAGVCGAILGNMHSYDVLHLSAAWGLFLIVWAAIHRGRDVALSWGRGILALAITLPTTLYQFYIYRVVAVFRQRANVPTLSPALWHYALGYGFVTIFALLAVFWLLRSRAGKEGRPDARETLAGFADRRTAVFAVCWAVAGIAVAYFPMAFQRKMIMGEHIPFCLLAGVGAAWLARRFSRLVQCALLTVIVLATMPSNIFFLRRDIRNLENIRSETGMRPFLPDTLYDAYGWIKRNTPYDAGVLGFPTDCAPLPGATGHVVWVGHWAETPDYGKKIAQFSRFADAQTPDDQRRAFLDSIPAKYLLYPNAGSQLKYRAKDGVWHEFADFAKSPPPYLLPVYRNQDYTVFQIENSVRQFCTPLTSATQVWH